MLEPHPARLLLKVSTYIAMPVEVTTQQLRFLLYHLKGLAFAKDAMVSLMARRCQNIKTSNEETIDVSQP
jgi:hypothetical protein